ncbi:LysR substrate-binding domain-containing protein [Klebsiella pneumoniae]|uniref:LysR substrate-binding domain-containing protein n=1 Tax=Klebsiella pneumoniae TaxID=573 RepID=UPI0039709B93
MIARFHFSYPEVVLELKEMTTARQVSALIGDSLDVGIVVLPVPEYATQKLLSQFFQLPVDCCFATKTPCWRKRNSAAFCSCRGTMDIISGTGRTRTISLDY